MPAPLSRQTVGILGEAIACDALRRRGYSILATRHRSRFGEIDIVARRGREITFVEVKARRSRRRGSAIEAVSSRKRRRIAAMALDYLAWTGQLDAPVRFAVVAIDGIGGPSMSVRFVEDAWTVDT